MGRQQHFLDDACDLLRGQGIQATGFGGDVRKEADAEGAVQKAMDT